ncbi:putative magnesium transporter NIPA4 [Panicum miliaceum]|uniref:Probable magnesium transporter n=1 Tax=Panicum miliaceum TaxID=4540 RepID=A0A3L6Q4X6_PANMI|nr:putative magnesium transporter NIPA4 [Panicum miliaceum]
MDVTSTASASGGREWYTGMSADNIKGLVLALSSSLFIGASFIIKKKGLKKAASSGVRAVIVGEVANFAAYAFAPAILVTPLGALSIIIRHEFGSPNCILCLTATFVDFLTNLDAVLAHVMLREKLHIFGILGCVLCVVGSTTIVLHAPPEREIESVTEVWDLATEPAFMCYAAVVIAIVAILVYRFVPLYGQTHVMVYIGVCSLVGSISVMSVKALGIALKLTFSGTNQLIYPQTWAFTLVVISCVITQMNYLNKALDTFNTAVVSPIYYTMFTSLTILASVIMFKDWDRQNPTQIVTEMCGFVTILSGTFLLHKTKDMADGGLSTSSSFRLPTSSSVRFTKQIDNDGEGIPLRSSESFRSPH